MADRHNRDLDRKPAPLPEPLPIPTIDSHAHIEIITDTEPDHPEVTKVIEDSIAVGINRIVQVGYSAEQSAWCVRLAELGRKMLWLQLPYIQMKRQLSKILRKI